MRQLFTRAAMIALTAGTLAACETTDSGSVSGARQGPTPNFPIVQAPPAVRPTPPADQLVAPPRRDEPETTQMTAPPPAAPVESRQLAPLTQAAPSAETRRLPPTPAPAPKPVTVTTVTGPVVEVAGPGVTYVVKKGDAIVGIARKLGVSQAELIEANGLKKPYRIKPGQELQGPATQAKAYVVQTGDTMFAIAKRFNVAAAALAEENDLKTGASIRKGQKLRLPAGFRDKGPTRTTTMLAGPAPNRSDAAQPTFPGPTASRPAPRPVEDEPAAEPSRPTSTTTVSVTGPVVELAGKPKIHVVKKGDAIDSIARELGTTRKALAEDNDLKSPYRINPGDRLKGPATTNKAYVVQTGDTVAEIARRFGVTPAALASANNLRRGAAVKKGQKLVLPDGFRDKGPIRTTVTTRPALPPQAVTRTPSVETPPVTTSAPPAYTPSAPIPYTPSRPIQAPPSSYPRTPTAPVAAQPALPGRAIIETAAPPTEAEITAAGRGRFVWPLRGPVISDFGPKGTGQRNDGLNIQSADGSPVRAAADGEVVYAGNQVPGFGNLVLIKHADGWVTAYAHLSSADVKMRQQVVQGQQIGEVGATGGVSEPQLHFEVRYAPTVKDKAKPVDPNLVLPK
ncbi:MAG: peptidase [Caulobacter sp.]|nr:peptidase [Caulobacter sp.]